VGAKLLIFILLTCGVTAQFTFDQYYVDTNYGGNTKPGWVRSADMDNDGDKDIVAGGGRALFVYENDGGPPDTWHRHGTAANGLDSTNNIGSNGAVLYDVDKDGYIDVVGAKYYLELGWWKNPGTLSDSKWQFTKLADENYYLHDLMLADLDNDGKKEEFVANLIDGSNIKINWYRPKTSGLWDRYAIESGRTHGNNNHAGLDYGDIDMDGNTDIAYSNGWYEASSSPTSSWTWHQVTTTSGISNALLRDLDGDNDLDLITASGHHSTGVYWFDNPGWSKHTIDGSLLNPECLGSHDLDNDNDFDIVTCTLDFDRWNQQVHNLYVFEHIGDIWEKHNIAPNSYPCHKLQLEDVNQDGQMDILSESAGYQVVSYYENAKTASIEFELEIVDNSYPGNHRPGWSAAGDMNKDGKIDVVAGGGQALQWYDAANKWQRRSISTTGSVGGNGGLVFDVDRDGDNDIVTALYSDDLIWMENTGSGFTQHTIDSSSLGFNHDLALGDIDGDGNKEVVALYVGTGGVVWYDIPSNPSSTWPKQTIVPSVSDPYLGLATGDLDSDGDVDVVISNSWYENPSWTKHTLFPGDPMQNVYVYDVNRDGRLDVVGAQGFYHATYSGGRGKVMWSEAPSWTARTIATNQDGPENIWAGDLNGDGFTDVMTGEMKQGTTGDSNSNIKVFISQNTAGTSWEEKILANNVGISARLFAVDIDNDGDWDFTADGNAEDHIYLWKNSGGGGYIPPADCNSNTECNDNNVCTNNICNNPGGPDAYCSFPSNTAPCNDGNSCTQNDRCSGGSCSGTTITQCIGNDGCCPAGCTDSTDSDCGSCEGLRALYHLDGDATDSQGSNDGTVIGATYTSSGRFGGAYNFDGSNDFINMPALDFFNWNEMTVSAWVKNDDGAAGTTNDIVSYWNYPDSRGWVLTHHRTNSYFFEIGGKGNIQGGTVDRNWHNVVAVYDGSYMRVYADGSQVASAGGKSGNLPSSNAQMRIGSQQDNNNFFDGIIDEVAIWDRALTQQEISSLSTSPITCGSCTALSISELSAVIQQWKDGTKTIEDVMQAIKSWKNGC